MNYFIVPLTPQTVNGQQVTAPEYLSTDMAGLSFSCIPYGVEGVGIVSLAAPSAALSAESDVFTFPVLTNVVTDSDLDPTVPTSFAAFSATNNIPTTIFVSGSQWQDVFISTCEIFLAAQAISGVLGTPIFSDGITPDSSVADSGMAPLVPSQNQLSKGGNMKAGGNAAVPTSNGPYDFTQIDGGSVSDALILLSQQFNGPILLGGTIGA